MKKLVLMFLVAITGVMTANATETIWLRTNVGSWSDNLDDWKIEGTWDGEQDVYEFEVPASKIGNQDFYFRIFRNNTDFQLGPYNHQDYSYVFADGCSETYDATANDSFKGENGAFCIKHSEIQASKYKISIYIKYPDGQDWKFYIKAEIVSMPVTVTEIGYATFSCDRALDFTGSGVQAYIADGKETGKVKMTAVTKVPANTGLFLKADASTYNVNVIATSEAPAVEDNLLVATDGNTVAAGNYVFAKENDDLGFYKLGSDMTISKGKAYLKAEAGAAARLSFTFGEEPTSITSVSNESLSNAYYDLQGRLVAEPVKGLYIVNGKKVIKK